MMYLHNHQSIDRPFSTGQLFEIRIVTDRRDRRSQSHRVGGCQCLQFNGHGQVLRREAHIFDLLKQQRFVESQNRGSTL